MINMEFSARRRITTLFLLFVFLFTSCGFQENISSSSAESSVQTSGVKTVSPEVASSNEVASTEERSGLYRLHYEHVD